MKRKDRFKWLASAALVALVGALALLAQSRADVPVPRSETGHQRMH
jgi:hypothetical protein